MKDFRVLQIDHVELFVPDRHEAARWYRQALGLEIVEAYRHWAEDPRGPLMISSDGGSTKLALFEGTPQGARATAGFHLVAFRVDAAGFVDFLRRVEDLGLNDHRGRPVASHSWVDHDKAYSIYFSDPYGHRLEITTYDYDAARGALTALRGDGERRTELR
jgi:catechol 2,3-dioxygenase-like lactoylglutathione lyase family enzyme